MSHPGHLLFLCRACHHRVRGPDVPDVGVAVGRVSQDELMPPSWGEGLTRVSVHVCADRTLGVTDLIGGVVDDVGDDVGIGEPGDDAGPNEAEGG